jgi:hypothetical protein
VIARATHEMPPIRLPYVEELFAFDYGRGRRAILTDDEVVAVLDADDPDPSVTLGRLADKVRMEIGHPPRKVRVFVARPDAASASIAIEERASVDGKRLFGEEFGYRQAVVTDLPGLERLLSSVDDLTYVSVSGLQVELGGRRGRCDRTATVTIDDVAALYQAHDTLETESAKQKGARAAFEKGFVQEILAARRAKNPEAAYLASLLSQDGGIELDAAERRLYRSRAKAAGLKVVPSEPGFSLDPQYDDAALARTLRRFVKSPCALLEDVPALSRRFYPEVPSSASPAISRILRALKEHSDERVRGCAAMGKYKKLYANHLQQVEVALRESEDSADWVAPLFRLRSELQSTPVSSLEEENVRVILGDLIGLARERDRFQCARYDGPLGGTRVGMNLFYTDLVAKLWNSLDYHQSAPVVAVSGFVSEPRAGMDPAWEEEERATPNTRLWFGPKREGYTRMGSGARSTMFFDRVATRVFAAGSNPADPSAAEVKPAEASRRALGWWDRHYAQVADHEQQYHLQNEIMKWSVVTGLLHEAGAVPFLREVKVRRDWTFDRWVDEMRPQLRYQFPIAVRPKAEWKDGRECIDILSSYTFSRSWVISGGVSLGGRVAAREAVALEEALPAALRRSVGMGTAERAWPRWIKGGQVEVAAQKATRLRLDGTELNLERLTVQHATSPTERTIALRAGEHELGHLEAATRTGRTELRWVEGDLERARAVVNRAAQIGDPPSSVQGVLTGARAPVVLEDGTTLLAREGGGAFEVSELGKDVAGGRMAPAHAGAGLAPANGPLLTGRGGARVAGVALDEGALTQRLSQFEWQALEATPGASQQLPETVLRRFTRAAPASGVDVVVDGVPGFEGGLKARVAADGKVWVARPDGGSSTWANLDRAAQLNAADLDAIRMAARDGRLRISRAELSRPEIEDISRALERRDPTVAERLVAAGPERAARLGEAEARVFERADLALANGDGGRALELYTIYEQSHGADPALLLRKGIARLEGGASSDVAAALEATPRLDPATRAGLVRSGNSEAAVLIDARAGRMGPSSAKWAQRVHLEADGPHVVSVLEGELHGAPASSTEIGFECLLKSCTVYVDDSISFSRVEFEADAGGNMAEMLRDPEVSWTKIERLDENFDPGLLVDPAEKARYRRMARVPNGAGDVTTSRTIVVARRTPAGDRGRAGLPPVAAGGCPLPF